MFFLFEYKVTKDQRNNLFETSKLFAVAYTNLLALRKVLGYE